MDINDLVAQANRPKRYKDVLEDYERAGVQMPVAEWAGTQGGETAAIGAGDDNWLRREAGRLSGAIDEGLESGFGTGVNIPGALREGGRTLVDWFGGNEEWQDKIGEAAGMLPRAAFDLAVPAVVGAGVGLATGGIGAPVAAAATRAALVGGAAMGALSTYGETGSPVAAAVVGGSSLAAPGVASAGGRMAARFAGAETLDKAAPEIIDGLNKLGRRAQAEAAAGEILPDGLTQWLARFGGSQSAMVGLSTVADAATNATIAGTRGEDTYDAFLDSFRPASLAANLVLDLPFTAMFDVPEAFAQKSPRKALLDPAIAEETRMAKEVYKKITGNDAPDSIVDSHIQSILGGNGPEIKFSRMSKLRDKPYLTSEGNIGILDAIESVRKVVGYKEDAKLGDKHDYLVLTALSDVEAQNKDVKLTKAEFVDLAARRVEEVMAEDNTRLNRLQTDVNWVEMETAALKLEQRRQKAEDDAALMTRLISPEITNEAGEVVTNPDYNPLTAQAAAIVFGTPQQRADVGLPTQINLAFGEGTIALTESMVDRLRGQSHSGESELFRLEDAMQDAVRRFNETSEGVLRDEIEAEMLIHSNALAKFEDETDTTKTVYGEQLLAEQTAAAQNAMVQYVQKNSTFDPANPQDVSGLFRAVSVSMKRAKLLWARDIDSAPYVKDDKGEVVQFATEAEAKRYTDEKNLDQSGVKNSRRDFVIEPDKAKGVFRVRERIFYRTESTTPLFEGTDVDPRALVDRDTADVGVINESPWDALDALELEANPNIIADAMQQLQAAGVGVGGRLGAAMGITDNLTYAVADLTDAQITKALFDAGKVDKMTNLREVALIRNRITKLMEFIRDGGDLKMQFVKSKQKLMATFETLAEAQEFVSGLDDTKYGIQRAEFKDEGGKAAYNVVENLTKEQTELRVTGDLEGLNEYMGVFGFDAPHRLRTVVRMGLNTFEQFYAISKVLRKDYNDPRAFMQPYSRGFVPRGLSQSIDYASDFLVPWKSDGKAKIAVPPNQKAETYSKQKVTYRTKDGAFRPLESDGKRPLLAATVLKLTENNGSVVASEMVGLLKDYKDELDPATYAMLDKLTAPGSFGRNVPIYFGVEANTEIKGRIATTADSVIGVILSPYSKRSSGKHFREIDSPAAIADTLIHELTHAHLHLVEKQNPEFASRLQQTYDTILDAYNMQSELLGVNKQAYTRPTLHGLESPQELLAAWWDDPQTREFLRNLPDYDKPLPGQTEQTMFGRMFVIIQRALESIFGRRDAGTMLERVRKLMVEGMELRRQAGDPKIGGNMWSALESSRGDERIITAPEVKPSSRTEVQRTPPKPGPGIPKPIEDYPVNVRLAANDYLNAQREFERAEKIPRPWNKQTVERYNAAKVKFDEANLVLNEYNTVPEVQTGQQKPGTTSSTAGVNDAFARRLNTEYQTMPDFQFSRQRTTDALAGFATHFQETREGVWVKPASLRRFMAAWEPIAQGRFWDMFKMEHRGGMPGFLVNDASLTQLAQNAEQLPPPRIPFKAPSAFETMYKIAFRNGLKKDDARAVARWALREVMRFPSSDEATWATSPQGNGVYDSMVHVVGINPNVKYQTLFEVAVHEDAHSAGFSAWAPVPQKMRQAVAALNKKITEMRPEDVRQLLNDINEFNEESPGVQVGASPANAMDNPHEVSANIIARMGNAILTSKNPSGTFGDLAMFTSPEITSVLRALDERGRHGLAIIENYFEESSGPSPVKILNEYKAFLEPLSRKADEIAKLEEDFLALRSLWPENYKNHLIASAEYVNQTEASGTNRIEAQVQYSKTSKLADDLLSFIGLGKSPDQPSFWMRTFAQFAQVATQHPEARPFYDMLANATGMQNQAIIKMWTALSGTPEVGKKTPWLGTFAKSQLLRKTWSDLARSQRERGEITGKPLTPEERRGYYERANLSGPDREIMERVYAGVSLQVAETSQLIAKSHDAAGRHIVHMVLARFGLTPEAAKSATNLVYQAHDAAVAGDYLASDRLVKQAQAQITDNDVFERVLQLTQQNKDSLQATEKTLIDRMAFYLPERLSREAYRRATGREAPQASGLDPATYAVLDQMHARHKRQLIEQFGEDEGTRLAALQDPATALREYLQAQSVTGLQAKWKRGKHRNKLDMFDVQQDYFQAVINSSKNRMIRMEGELLMTHENLKDKPVKELIKQHIENVLAPDSDLGRNLALANFVYFMGGNLSSMAIEPFQQFVSLVPALIRNGMSTAGAYKALAAANAEFVKSKAKGKFENPDLSWAIDKARKMGVIDFGAYSDIAHNEDLALVNAMRRGGGMADYSKFDLLKNRVYSGAMSLARFYAMSPAYNSEVAFIAGFNHFKKQGLTNEQAFNEARFLKEGAMFGGGRINRPVGLFNTREGWRTASQAMWSLQSYTSSMFTIFGYDLKQSFRKPSPEGMSPAQSKQVRKAAVVMFGTQLALAGALGMPLVGGAMAVLQQLFPEENLELEIRAALAELPGDDEAMGATFSSALMNGLPSAMEFAPDLGSRLGLGSLLGVSSYNGMTWENFVGPTGSLVGNVVQGLGGAVKGDVGSLVRSTVPVGIQRLWDGLTSGSEYRDSRGNLMANDLTLGEGVARAAGFAPSRVRRMQTADKLARQSAQAANLTKQGKLSEWAKLYQAGDIDKVRTAMAEFVERYPSYTVEDLTRALGKQIVDQTLPKQWKDVGTSKAGTGADVISAAGTQTPAPGELERLQLQAKIAQSLGVAGATPGRQAYRRAARVDSAMAVNPGLTVPEASQAGFGIGQLPWGT